MATRRMIDPQFWQSETVGRWTFRQRLLFIGLFSNADDQGRLRAHPALIRSTIFPYDDIPLSEITNDLKALTSSVILYKVEGHDYCQIAGWWKYQSPQWAYPSKIPPPDGWNDQLRFRHDNKVFTLNWPGIPDTPSVSLGKPLPKAIGNPIELVVGLGLEDVENLESGDGAKDAPSPSPSTPSAEKPKEPKKPDPEKIPLTPTGRQLAAMWGVKRVNSTQAAAIVEMSGLFGHDKVIEAAKWAHLKSMAFGEALAAMQKALPTWGQKGNGNGRDHQTSTRKSVQSTVAAATGLGEWPDVPAADDS